MYLPNARRWRRWMQLALLASAGGTTCSCATDFRDSLITGAMDYVSGTVTSSIGSVLPIAEIIDQIVRGGGGGEEA